MPVEQRLSHVALTPTGQGDQPLVLLRQPAALDMGHAVTLPLEVALAEQLTEIQIAFPVLAQQDQTRGMAGIVRIFQQHIGPDDGLDTRPLTASR